MAFDPSAAAQPGSGVFGLPHSERDAGVVLVPVPFEATTSYGGGTSRGPEAILDASRQVDLFDVETGRPYLAGIHMVAAPDEISRLDRAARAAAEPVIAAGGVIPGRADLAEAAAEVDRACERVNAWVEERVAGLLARGKRVGLVGGDHSTALGAIAAHARHHPGMGVLHVDAHADLRGAFEGFTYSHASILHNVAERLPEVSRRVQVGIRGLFEGEPWAAQVRRLLEPLPREVYVTFDVDGLDPTLCPGTGTPVPGGLSFHEASHLLGALASSGRRIVGFDLVEVAPTPDGGDWDGNVGARLLYKLIGWMLRSAS